jgi:hypothetical protein
VFKAALLPYMERIGAGVDDLTYIQRGAEEA